MRWLTTFRRLVWHTFNPVTVGARILLLRGGKVLLVRQHNNDGWWCLPGGSVEAGETAEQAARREMREELAADLGALRLEGIYTNFKEGKSDHVVVFSCQDFRLGGKANFEISAWDFFAPDGLPEKTFAGHRRRIESFFSGDWGARCGQW